MTVLVVFHTNDFFQMENNKGPTSSTNGSFGSMSSTNDTIGSMMLTNDTIGSMRLTNDTIGTTNSTNPHVIFPQGPTPEEWGLQERIRVNQG